MPPEIRPGQFGIGEPSKRFNITSIEGQYEPGPNGTPFAFVAQDWRKRGGGIEIRFEPISQKFADQIPALFGKNSVAHSTTEIPPEICYSTARPHLIWKGNGEFQSTLARILAEAAPYWGCPKQNLTITSCNTLQFTEDQHGKPMSYELFLTQEMRSTVLEGDLREGIMALSQAAQRLRYLNAVEHLYLERTEDTGFPTRYKTDKTDTPIYLLAKHLLKDNLFIPKEDREVFQKEALPILEFTSGIRHRLELFVAAWEKGGISVFDMEQTAIAFDSIISWICRRYGIDEHKYLWSDKDFLHRAKVVIVGLEPCTPAHM